MKITKTAMQLPKVVMLFGLPGSGKGTQAEILSERFGFFHFDTGKEVEKIVMDPSKQDDPVIQRERKNFEIGLLSTPSWFEQMVRERIEAYAAEGRRLVFSGSPRTIEEVTNLHPLFEKLFGKDKLTGFLIKIKDETSIFRNSHRRVCRKCRFPITWTVATEWWKHCPKCGATLVRRVLDTPDVIKERIREFRNRTEPTIDFLKKNGVSVVEIDGEHSPEVVSHQILSYLEKDGHND